MFRRATAEQAGLLVRGYVCRPGFLLGPDIRARRSIHRSAGTYDWQNPDHKAQGVCQIVRACPALFTVGAGHIDDGHHAIVLMGKNVAVVNIRSDELAETDAHHHLTRNQITLVVVSGVRDGYRILQ